MAGSSPISRAGTPSRRPTGSSALTAGAGRRSNPSACWPARTEGTFLAIYIARVRVTVQAKGTTVIREGHGTGEGRGTSPGEVHDIALKAAETDATKRALATFGKPFGLELYRGGKAATSENPCPRRHQSRFPLMAVSASTRMTRRRSRGHRTIMAAGIKTRWPSTSGMNDARPNGRWCRYTQATRSAPPLAPNAQPDLTPGRIDKSVLAIAEPKRLRDKAHLKFVASQPCLVCGRQPSDPHHLRFAQPEPSALKSATSSPFPSAAVITGSCIRPAMRSPGGRTSTSSRWRSPRGFGSRRGQNPRRQKRSNPMKLPPKPQTET